MQGTHDSFKMERCVFFISNAYPFIGVSPDSVVECNCCGKGTVEIKCPYCVRDKVVADCLEKLTCLENVDGKIQLRKSHQYYYQITPVLLSSADQDICVQC